MTSTDKKTTEAINPYDPTGATTPRFLQEKRFVSLIVAGFSGAILSVVLTFPVASLMALAFRFPIPFDSYRSGPDAMVPAFFATLFYGLFGGFMVVGILGAVEGIIAAWLSRPSRKKQWIAIWITAAGIATTGVFALAILDKIVGPW